MSQIAKIVCRVRLTLRYAKLVPRSAAGTHHQAGATAPQMAPGSRRRGSETGRDSCGRIGDKIGPAEPIESLGDIQHRAFRLRLSYLFREKARFRRAFAPAAAIASGDRQRNWDWRRQPAGFAWRVPRGRPENLPGGFVIISCLDTHLAHTGQLKPRQLNQRLGFSPAIGHALCRHNVSPRFFLPVQVKQLFVL